MPRRSNADLSKDWKVVLPATLAGSVEFELLDAGTGKPRYGERSRLIGYLLTNWLAGRGKILPFSEKPSADLITEIAQVPPKEGNAE